jgi:esterase/lipase superfamily enzyme
MRSRLRYFAPVSVDQRHSRRYLVVGVTRDAIRSKTDCRVQGVKSTTLLLKELKMKHRQRRSPVKMMFCIMAAIFAGLFSAAAPAIASEERIRAALFQMASAEDQSSAESLAGAGTLFELREELGVILTPAEASDVMLTAAQAFFDNGCLALAVRAAEYSALTSLAEFDRYRETASGSHDRAALIDYTSYHAISVQAIEGLLGLLSRYINNESNNNCFSEQFTDISDEVEISDEMSSQMISQYQRRLASLMAYVEQEDTRLRDSGGSPQYEVVRLFWGTNREISGDDAEILFSNRRAALQYGSIEVSVPTNRAQGSIPRPGALDFRGARDGVHMILRPAASLGGSGFGGALESRLADDGAEEMFVFIHGHAVTFAQAALQTAQLAVDLDLRAGAAFFSWPNGHSVASYQVSQNAVPLSVRALENFLETVAQEASGKRVHLIAHSMGARVLLGALERLAARGAFGGGPLFGEIVWASPDVDADYFGEALRDLPPVAAGMTAYMSRHDRALQLSSVLGGNFPRAGQSAPLAAIAELVVAVDTSDVTSGIGHGDFAAGALNDLRAIIWLSLPPSGRCILVDEHVSDQARFWRAVDQRPECAQPDFLQALRLARQHGVPSAIDRIDRTLGSIPGSAPETVRLQSLRRILAEFEVR